MKLSIVIPAFNEEKLLPRCLESVRHASSAISNRFADWEFEVIVCDNNSTDATSEVARQGGATVVFEAVNLIAKARNAGAKVATGDWILFIDADSKLESATLEVVLEKAISEKFVAGGCLVGLDDMPWWGYPLQATWNTISRTMNWAAGSFIFCRTEAFRAIDGFDEQRYAAEELDLSQRLKQWGRERKLKFHIITKHRHRSSGRKFHLYSGFEVFRLAMNVLFLHPWAIRRKRSLDFFYDGRR